MRLVTRLVCCTANTHDSRNGPLMPVLVLRFNSRHPFLLASFPHKLQLFPLRRREVNGVLVRRLYLKVVNSSGTDGGLDTTVLELLRQLYR
jgi:hypothetical protein